MPRTANTTTQLSSVIESFAQRIGQTLERFITGRVEKELSHKRPAAAGRGGGRRKRGVTLCYYPGCKNVAAPRFGMFCAALHKNISAAQKAEYRAQHDKKNAKPKGKPGRPPGSGHGKKTRGRPAGKGRRRGRRN
jgi:hypothetical protein